MVDQASLMWFDSSAHWNHSEESLFWVALRPLLVCGKLEEWSHWHRNVLVSHGIFAWHLDAGAAWGRLLVSHDEVRAVKVKDHATQRDVEAGAQFPLVQKEKRLCRHFCQERSRHTQACFFGSPKQLLHVPPWPSKLRDGRQRPTSCSGSGAGATPGLPRQERGLGLRAQGSSASHRRRSQRRLQVCDWLPPIVPSRFSQYSHLDPRTFRGHSLQLGRVFDSGGRALDRAIIFCAKCGAAYWERADALCRSCSGIPGGQTLQIHKLRSGLFPNKRCPGWTVEHVRRPTLDEATTLVAQLESCEAGLSRCSI